MKYAFVHLSDLHYRADWPEETGIVCEKFLTDLEGQIQPIDEPYLVFSGDLVQEGDDGKLYEAFQDRFGGISIPAARRICVPGNHDVSRQSMKPMPTILKGALSGLTSEELFNGSMPQLAEMMFKKKFTNYSKCETEFAGMTCCTPDLGGTGWKLSANVGVFCLNTALCSFGGLLDPDGKPIPDKDALQIDTRILHRWLADEKFPFRILVMHHPLDWLADWAKLELGRIIANNFQLVFSGHIHLPSSTFVSRGDTGAIYCSAPPLFTRKSGQLGYSIVTLDDADRSVEVLYRQWTADHKFVLGTSFSGTDTGKKKFPLNRDAEDALSAGKVVAGDTLAILQAEFDEACTSYGTKRQIWVDRDLSSVAETARPSQEVVTPPLQLAIKPRECVIRAPGQFGLTCLGYYLALEHAKASAGRSVIIRLDTTTVPHHRRGIIQSLNTRCAELSTSLDRATAIVLDNWTNEKPGRKIVRELKSEYPHLLLIILNTCEDFGNIAGVIEADETAGIETLYLWALTRARVRELVGAYTYELINLDEAAVTQKVIADIDALNIHRTPSNCLMILRLVEQAFDDSPVNRTEMISRFLNVLFYTFDNIPRYAVRPDLKDCEYALGYVAEWLVRSSKRIFTKEQFYSKVGEYTKERLLDLDCEVLFSFLVSESILVRKGINFEFRFSYWLYFFAAHRMHHDAEFAGFILSDKRYSAMPEIIEFYTGIDRRREDAVVRLTQDLAAMNTGLVTRLGIPSELNPYEHLAWTPSPEALDALEQHIADSVAESSLPSAVKDAIADRHYDRSKPYNQELAVFMTNSTLRQLVQTMRGAARALRNSDHVRPEAKRALLEEVFRAWVRVCQVLFILSPVLASTRHASYEDMNFRLDSSFDANASLDETLKTLLLAIADNIVRWYQDDLFSRKMGALLAEYSNSRQSTVEELLAVLLLIKQRPPRWEDAVEASIVRANKNSFTLSRVFLALRFEFIAGFSGESAKQQLRRLAAMALAKHHTGSKHPNTKLIEKAAKALDEHERKNAAS